jgi:hypothetical protein
MSKNEEKNEETRGITRKRISQLVYETVFPYMKLGRTLPGCGTMFFPKPIPTQMPFPFKQDRGAGTG